MAIAKSLDRFRAINVSLPTRIWHKDALPGRLNPVVSFSLPVPIDWIILLTRVLFAPQNFHRISSVRLSLRPVIDLTHLEISFRQNRFLDASMALSFCHFREPSFFRLSLPMDLQRQIL